MVGSRYRWNFFVWTDISPGPLAYFSKALFEDIPLAYFFSCELVVDGTADGKDNKKDKTSEVAEIKM